MSNEELVDEELYTDWEEPTFYSVVIRTTTEYSVEYIKADSEEEAIEKAREAVESDFGWSTSEVLDTRVVHVEEEL